MLKTEVAEQYNYRSRGTSKGESQCLTYEEGHYATLKTVTHRLVEGCTHCTLTPMPDRNSCVSKQNFDEIEIDVV